ncbi:uncharacterized protein C5orf47 homolog [Falco biarmicus]|uniref:uncharacterized protein C5orf47 homolog n=1 Tax=Falco rusticolus TaxID=120794 RepID=UPI001886A2DF|nr:uncharacterized protein C5orf47 homolog [Falco rusticolus]XP_055574434.1 uncharacterized protein C5orf47 homolog [Falco cherrug]XP_056205161.1 uncharacterized protein C5orf47 homolog [Falco biarmicus]
MAPSHRTRREGSSAEPPGQAYPKEGATGAVSPLSVAARTPAPPAPATTCHPATAGPGRPPAPPPMAAGPSRGRTRLRLLYSNSFGSHRCGSVVRYGGGRRQAEGGWDEALRCQPSPAGQAGGLRGTLGPGDQAHRGRGPQAVGSGGAGKPVSHHHADLREAKADTFDFPFPSRNSDKVIKRKKQKSKVWLKVWKVISRMLEENEKFRSRLLTCSQFSGEGNDMNQSSQDEVSYLDREESIFGWV